MNAASLATAAVTVWPTADAERKGLILNELFRQAWADIAADFYPIVVTLPIDPDLLPGGVMIDQTFDEDGEEAGGTVRRIDNLTLAELQATMAIQRGNILRENAHFKALACLLASKILDGVGEDDLVLPGTTR